MELFAMRSTVHVEEAHLCGQADGIDDQLAVLVTPSRFAEPGRLHIFGMLVGHVDAASEGVALPQHVDHIHLRALYEEERLRGPKQLSGNASRIASRRGQE